MGAGDTKLLELRRGARLGCSGLVPRGVADLVCCYQGCVLSDLEVLGIGLRPQEGMLAQV